MKKMLNELFLENGEIKSEKQLFLFSLKVKFDFQQVAENFVEDKMIMNFLKLKETYDMCLNIDFVVDCKQNKEIFI